VEVISGTERSLRKDEPSQYGSQTWAQARVTTRIWMERVPQGSFARRQRLLLGVPVRFEGNAPRSSRTGLDWFRHRHSLTQEVPAMSTTGSHFFRAASRDARRTLPLWHTMPLPEDAESTDHFLDRGLV